MLTKLTKKKGRKTPAVEIAETPLVCKCDELRCYPVQFTEDLAGLELVMWQAAHDRGDGHTKAGRCDGWHMVKCLPCTQGQNEQQVQD